MRKNVTIVALLSALMATSAAWGAQPFQKGLTAPRQLMKAGEARISLPLRAAEASVLYEEDFSKFSDGSEEAPAAEIEYVDGYHISDAMTQTPGWTGGGIHPAGGCIALMDRVGLDHLGFISTPPADLGGTATLTFRAKLLPGTKKANLWVVLCDDYYGPGDDQADFTLTDEWQEFTLKAEHGSLEEPSYFQLQAEEGHVLIDDIRVEFSRTRLAAPYALPATNLSPTSFSANWEPTAAPTYRLNVICKRKAENSVSGTIVEGFDSLNADADGRLDAAAPGIPEDWNLELAANGSREVSGEAGWQNSKPYSIVFDAVGDAVTSPATPEPLCGLKFWIRPSQMEEGEDLSLLRIEIYHSLTGTWENIAQLPYYWMTEKGDFYEIDSDALGEDATMVRLSMIQKGLIDFYVDDITLDYATSGITEFLLKDHMLEEDHYVVENINPENNYFYYVQAVDGELESATSDMIWVDGIVGLAPEVSAPTDVTPTSFTANWNRLGHATDYKVEANFIVRAASDMEDVTLSQETFDKIEQEGYDWVSPYDFAAAGMAETSWKATQPCWQPGMAGSQGTSWIGAAGLVYSPNLDLSVNQGAGFDVEATVVTTIDGFELADGSTHPEGVFVMVLNTYLDSQAMASALIDTPEAGSHHATVHIDTPDDLDVSNVIVAFMTMSGQRFYVDDVRISKDLRAGDELSAPLAVRNTDGVSTTFDGLREGYDHTYRVTASTVYQYVDYVSDTSETIYVFNSEVGVGSAADEAVRIVSGRGFISVDAPEGVAVNIHSLSGMRVVSEAAPGRYDLEPGIYMVNVAGRNLKTIVR